MYIAQAYAAEDGGDLDGQLYALTKQMSELKLLPTNRMYSLSMEAALRSNNLEVSCQ